MRQLKADMTQLIPMFIVFAVSIANPIPTLSQELNIVGSYELISSTREILETGEVVNTFGDDPKGYIMYGADGRMLVLLTRGDRVAPESLATMSDENRADLFRSMNAYGGTYTLDGDTIHHHIDISSNERWNGTTVTRHIRAEGEYLIYTAEPAPFSGDGRMSVATLRWKKVD